MARTSSIYDHFDLYLAPVTWPWPSTYLKNVSNGTCPPRGQQPWQCLKSMHKCTCYGPDKLIIWPIWPLFDPCDLDLYLNPVTLTFNLPLNVSNGTSPPQGQQFSQIVLKSMHYCTSYGTDKSDAYTVVHRTNFVTNMSPLHAGSTKLKMLQFLIGALRVRFVLICAIRRQSLLKMYF